MSATESGRLGKLRGSLALPAALLIFGLVFVYLPSQIYGPWLPFHLGAALAVLLPMGLFASGMLALPSLFGSAIWRAEYGALLAAIGVGLWVSAVLSLGSLAILDGRHLDHNPSLENALVNIGVILAAAAAVYKLALRFRSVSSTFLWIVNALFVLAAAVATASHSDAGSKGRGEVSQWSAFSSSANVLVLLLDGFQSKLFVDLLEEQPALRRELDGFTFFPHAVSSAPTTMFSLPGIHSGTTFSGSTAGKSFKEYFSSSIGESSFLAELAASGYRAHLINPMLHVCPRGVVCAQASQLGGDSVRSLIDSALLLVSLSIYRVSPLQWKSLVYNEGKWLIGTDQLRAMVASGYSTLDELASTASVDSGSSSAKFIHVLTSHPPPIMDDSCVVRDGIRLTEQTLLDQARCSMRAVSKVLDTLKSAGVYDNSLIVILADHGAGLSSDGFALGGSASPLLLVKKPDQTGPMQIVQDLSSLLEVKALVCRTSKACGSETNAIHESHAAGHRMPRLFSDYQWHADGWMSSVPP